MAILAGLSPAALTNSNSAVNTRRDSKLLEANSSVTNTAEHNSGNVSASCQHSSLTLTHTVARSETLESPAYVPSDFSVLPSDVTAALLSEVISSGVQQGGTDVQPKHEVQTSNDACQSPSAVASISIETETPSVISNVSAYEKLLPAQQAAAGKTSKFAAVKRRFTVSKTVLPSSTAPSVVVFSKLAAESDIVCEVQRVDDASRVHIVDKAQASSDVTAINKSPVGEADSSSSSFDVSAATEAVTDVLTASASTLESTVIMTNEACVDEADGDVEDVSVSQVVQETFERNLQSVQSTDVQVYSENDDSQVSDGRCEGDNADMQQYEVTTESCAASADLETSTLPCKSCYQVNWEDSPCKDIADLHETTTSDGECGIVPASVLQESCPTAVGNTASDRGSELKCTTDELPSSDASDDILVAPVIDSVASCSIVQQVTAPMPSAASSLLCSVTLQQRVHCDNNPQIAESMLSVSATQCSSPLQDETDDKC